MLRLLPRLAFVAACALFAAAATAAAPKSGTVFLLLDVRGTSDPWNVLIKSHSGSFVKVDDSGVSEISDAQTVSGLDGHPPKSAGIMFVSLAQLINTDRLFQRHFLPALARHLGVSEDQIKVDFPRPTSLLGQDVRKALLKGELSQDMLFLMFVATYESLGADLDAKDVETRRVAVRTAARIHSANALKLLIAALADDDDVVRITAQEEIVRRGSDARALLRATLSPNASADDRVLKTLQRVEYDAAIRSDTPAGYSEFLSRYPYSRFADEIQYRYFNAKGDTAGLKKFSDSFPNGGGGNLVELLENGALEVSIVDITRTEFVPNQIPEYRTIRYAPGISLRLRRLTTYPLRVRIPAGTYFASAAAPSQDRLATSEKVVSLTGDQEVSVVVPAVYVGAFYERVGEEIRFTVNAAPSDRALRTLATSLAERKPGNSIWQAAVWIVGSDMSYDVMTSVRNSSSSLISDDDIVAALRLFEADHIDVSRSYIWLARPRLVASLKDDSNKQWLKQRLSSELAGDPARAFERIEAYQIGTTTIEAFFDDGWTLTDAVSGRMGIVMYTSSRTDAEYLLGTCGMQQTAREQMKKDMAIRGDGQRQLPRLETFNLSDHLQRECAKAYRLKFEDSVLRSREKLSGSGQ